jgi:hypothetical protein
VILQKFQILKTIAMHHHPFLSFSTLSLPHANRPSEATQPALSPYRGDDPDRVKLLVKDKVKG